MNLEEDILIQNYLTQSLSEKENKNFVERLKTDSSFKEKFSLEEEIFKSLNKEEWSFIEDKNHTKVKEYEKIFKNEETKEIKKILKKEKEKYQKTQNKKTNKKRSYYIAAALVALIISLYNIINTKESTQNIVVNYLNETELPSIIERGEQQNELAKAQKLFENKEYNKALQIFEKEMQNQKNTKSVIYLYTGVSQMQINKLEEANKTFQKLIESELLDAPKGKWYKALVYIKMNKIKEAKEILNTIVKSKTYNFKKAEKLLKELD